MVGAANLIVSPKERPCARRGRREINGVFLNLMEGWSTSEVMVTGWVCGVCVCVCVCVSSFHSMDAT